MRATKVVVDADAEDVVGEVRTGRERRIGGAGPSERVGERSESPGRGRLRPSFIPMTCQQDRFQTIYALRPGYPREAIFQQPETPGVRPRKTPA